LVLEDQVLLHLQVQVVELRLQEVIHLLQEVQLLHLLVVVEEVQEILLLIQEIVVDQVVAEEKQIKLLQELVPQEIHLPYHPLKEIQEELVDIILVVAVAEQVELEVILLLKLLHHLEEQVEMEQQIQ
tara:strand:- start:260 stop:643 length:384 start_codon:yes stop_codon:yes gene_type:complete